MLKDKLPAIAVTAVVAGGVAVLVSNMISSGDSAVTVDVKVPQLSQQASVGRKAFDENCSQCHGENGSGSAEGPPLVHSIYNPGHHADGAFFLAAKIGVRQHHWKFGNMPSLPNVKETDVKSILSYVRELQRANGIFYKPHNM